MNLSGKQIVFFWRPFASGPGHFSGHVITENGAEK
jgi:hypothetical protein